MEIISDLLGEFIVEATAHIADIEAHLLRMEALQNDDGIINEVFRAAHSIKGTAGFFALNKIVELAHAIETLFGEFREHRLTPTSEMIDVLLSAVDVLKELIVSPGESEKHEIFSVVAGIRRFLDDSNNSKPCEDLSAWDIWNQLTSADEGEIDAADSSSKTLAALPDMGKNQPDFETRSYEISKEESVRVSVGLLNDLLTLAGEMVLRRNQLLRISDAYTEISNLEEVAKGIDDLTTKLQKNIMKSRMQPIANVFNKFPRIVRDLSRKVGKEVDLIVLGEDVELDRSLVESLVDPMTHLVRNALDHGIEKADLRQLNNKPATGLLTLRAYHESGRVIVEVSDDGSGIDIEKVKGKAVEKKLVDKTELAAMRDAEIINLIMSPGFSTADNVTDISGRGVGMDVVKTNIEKLGGKIEIVSDLGIGTTFRLILPLTLAIISSFIVMSDGQSFVIPQANVRELLLIQSSNENQVEMVQNSPILRLRGQLLALVRLRDVLFNNCETDVDYFLDSSKTFRILVIKTGSSVYGLVVDSVYDTEEILVKPLSSLLSNSGLYSGSTVLGDGKIAMILDTERIRMLAGFSSESNIAKILDSVAKRVDAEKQYLLLFRCSGSEMLGLDLAMVLRVEKVEISQLKKIGAKYYFTYQGQTIRVIKPEHYLPISSKKTKRSTCYIIIPRQIRQPVGILAKEIYDSIYTKVSLDEGGVIGKGILGSTLINQELVTLINLHELFTEAVPEYYNRLLGPPSKIAAVNKNTSKLILLVEDTPFFLRIVKNYLECEGFRVITAENGMEALDKFKQFEIDLVISDIEMPLMSGIELVRAIRANNHLLHIPVIALTSLTGENNKEKGLRAGFDLYEFKLDRARLIGSVNQLLNK